MISAFVLLCDTAVCFLAYWHESGFQNAQHALDVDLESPRSSTKSTCWKNKVCILMQCFPHDNILCKHSRYPGQVFATNFVTFHVNSWQVIYDVWRTNFRSSRTILRQNCGFVHQQTQRSETVDTTQVNGCSVDLCVSLFSSCLVRHS